MRMEEHGVMELEKKTEEVKGGVERSRTSRYLYMRYRARAIEGAVDSPRRCVQRETCVHFPQRNTLYISYNAFPRHYLGGRSNTAAMAEQLPMEVRLLTEDDIYRTSSQFRFWSFSPEKLAARRQTTHQLAIERIESQRRGAKNGTAEAASRSEHGEYLTEEEELRLVQRCCEQIRASSDHFKWPVSVKVRVDLATQRRRIHAS